ncbi:MAG: sigma-70 family RNA polymerase sigma factor [Acidimicrobiales bacterium]
MNELNQAWPLELQALYRSSFESLVRLAAILVGRRWEAEEIVHDAFLATSGRVQDIENLDAYVRRAVVNGSYGVLRRRRGVDGRAVDPPPDEAPLYLIEFRDILMALSWNQRAVVVLRFFEGLSVRETAEVIGCPESTVRSHSRRALKALGKVLPQ